MKRTDGLILTLIIIVIVAIAIWAFIFSNEDSEEQKNENKASRLESLINRLKVIQKHIKDEMERLRLTTKMEEFLEKRIGRIFLMVKAIFFVLFTFGVYLFVYSGCDLLSALFNTIGIVSFVGVAIPFLFLSKILDPNALIDFVKKEIRVLTYNKYGHKPEMIGVLTESIESKKNLEKELRGKINSLSA